MTDPRQSRPGVGFPLLGAPDQQGQLGFPTTEQSVRQSIEIILRTRPGELLQHPEFGAGLEDFVGQPNSPTTRRRIQEVVGSSLARWEPRLEPLRVDVEEIPDRPTQVRVQLTYRLKRTGAVQQLGLAIDLGA
ncbi:MAG TPA: GPW/gp25 family protein [Myxococcaceae bacterium]|nr:GPW/gp25 family protein [Myxococcaceae bacterium]